MIATIIREAKILFVPPASPASLEEKVISGFSAFMGIGFVLFISQTFLSANQAPLIVASMGASSVLLFAVPQGPMSQPWAFAGGHLISAFIGISCAKIIADPSVAAASAVGLAITVMYLSRCLHPPGAACALAAVVSGQAVLDMGYQFLLTPVLINVVVLLAWAMVINNILPKRCYPNTLKLHNKSINAKPVQANPLSIQKEDLQATLKEMDVYVDVSDDELTQIFNLSAMRAKRKLMGEVLCKDVMASPVISAQYGDDVEHLWSLMTNHEVRGIPVIDRVNQVIGIVTISDFLKQIKPQKNVPLVDRMAYFLKKTQGLTTEKSEYAGHLMTSSVVTINENKHILEVSAIFHGHDIHYLPVVDDRNKLVGMLTPKSIMLPIIQTTS
jgi:CBS domain-containing membrane protein